MPSLFSSLERDGLLTCCRCSRSVAPSVQKLDLVGDDFRPVAFAAGDDAAPPSRRNYCQSKVSYGSDVRRRAQRAD